MKTNMDKYSATYIEYIMAEDRKMNSVALLVLLSCSVCKIPAEFKWIPFRLCWSSNIHLTVLVFVLYKPYHF